MVVEGLGADRLGGGMVGLGLDVDRLAVVGLYTLGTDRLEVVEETVDDRGISGRWTEAGKKLHFCCFFFVLVSFSL